MMNIPLRKKIFLFTFFGCSWIGVVYPFKILIVVDFFPHPTRPFIMNQITGLIDRGHSVTIIAKKIWEKDTTIPLDVHKYNLLSKTIYAHFPNDIDIYDIVYCQIGHLAPKFAHYKALHKSKWKLVTAYRGFDATTAVMKDSHIYDELFIHGDLFLPVCEYFKNCLIDIGCPSKKIKVHHSAIDCKQFVFSHKEKPQNGEINLVTIGRLEPLKGHEYAIRAVAKLLDKKMKINYTIIGSGQMFNALNALIKKLGYQDNIKIIGSKKHEDIHHFLSNAHIFLLASVTTADLITEGIPNVLMEAMACGIPVVSTCHAGIPELVKNGVSGFLIPEKDILGLANKLEYLASHSELWSILGSAGHNYVLKEHNIEINNDKLDKLLCDVLKKNK